MKHGIEASASAEVIVTVEGWPRPIRLAGPITGIEEDRPPIQDFGPDGYYEFLPGPDLHLTLTFKAHELERGPV